MPFPSTMFKGQHPLCLSENYGNTAAHAHTEIRLGFFLLILVMHFFFIILSSLSATEEIRWHSKFIYYFFLF